MTDILQELSALRRVDAEALESRIPFREMERRAVSAPAARDFATAFRRAPDGSPRVISELKRASPSEGMIREDFRPLELAKALEGAGAAALSVLCEPHRFLGGGDYLREVRPAVSIPVLWKDFVTTRYQIAEARASGADAVLLIAAVLDDAALRALLAFAHDLGFRALVETHDGTEISRAVEAGAEIVGVNCRNLRNFRCDTSLLETLVAAIPGGKVRIAESGMHSAEDIRRAAAAGADGFLVGTELMRAADPAARLRELKGE